MTYWLYQYLTSSPCSSASVQKQLMRTPCLNMHMYLSQSSSGRTNTGVVNGMMIECSASADSTPASSNQRHAGQTSSGTRLRYDAICAYLKDEPISQLNHPSERHLTQHSPSVLNHAGRRSAGQLRLPSPCLLPILLTTRQIQSVRCHDRSKKTTQKRSTGSNESGRNFTCKRSQAIYQQRASDLQAHESALEPPRAACHE